MSQGSESRREEWPRSAPSVPKGSTLLPRPLEPRPFPSPGPQQTPAPAQKLPTTLSPGLRSHTGRNTCPADTYPLDRGSEEEGKENVL